MAKVRLIDAETLEFDCPLRPGRIHHVRFSPAIGSLALDPKAHKRESGEDAATLTISPSIQVWRSHDIKCCHATVTDGEVNFS